MSQSYTTKCNELIEQVLQTKHMSHFILVSAGNEQIKVRHRLTHYHQHFASHEALNAAEHII